MSTSTADDEIELFTIAEFCRRFSTSRSGVYREIGLGHLRARKIGKRTVIALSDARAWASALPPLETRQSG